MGRPPGTCEPGVLLNFLRIIKSAVTAVSTFLTGRGLWQDVRHVPNFNQLTRTSTFFHPREPLHRHRPALGAFASCCRNFVLACGPGDGALLRVARSLGLCSFEYSCCAIRSRTAYSRSLRKQQKSNTLFLHSRRSRKRVQAHHSNSNSS